MITFSIYFPKKNREFSLSIGHGGRWHGQLALITVTEVEILDGQIDYAWQRFSFPSTKYCIKRLRRA